MTGNLRNEAMQCNGCIKLQDIQDKLLKFFDDYLELRENSRSKTCVILIEDGVPTPYSWNYLAQEILDKSPIGFKLLESFDSKLADKWTNSR